MSFRLSSFSRCLPQLLVAVSVVAAGHARAADRGPGRSIEFSDPRSSDVITNLHQWSSRKDGLRQLEEDLDRPLRGLAPRSSLEGVIAPPPPQQPVEPAIANKRVRELIERQKYWAFMSLEDLLHTPTAEEVLKVPTYGPDGQVKKPLSPLERFYERLDPKGAGRAKPGLLGDDSLFGSTKAPSEREGLTAREEAELPGSLGTAEKDLRKALAPDAENATRPDLANRSIFSDIFGQGEVVNRERSDAEKARMDEFKQLLGIPTRAPASDANPLTELISAATRPEVKPVGVLPGVPPAGSVPVAGALANPFGLAYIGGVPPSATAQALTAPPPPPPPSPQNLITPKSTFDFPRRKF